MKKANKKKKVSTGAKLLKITLGYKNPKTNRDKQREQERDLAVQAEKEANNKKGPYKFKNL